MNKPALLWSFRRILQGADRPVGEVHEPDVHQDLRPALYPEFPPVPGAVCGASQILFWLFFLSLSLPRPYCFNRSCGDSHVALKRTKESAFLSWKKCQQGRVGIPQTTAVVLFQLGVLARRLLSNEAACRLGLLSQALFVCQTALTANLMLYRAAYTD